MADCTFLNEQLSDMKRHEKHKCWLKRINCLQLTKSKLSEQTKVK